MTCAISAGLCWGTAAAVAVEVVSHTTTRIRPPSHTRLRHGPAEDHPMAQRAQLRTTATATACIQPVPELPSAQCPVACVGACKEPERALPALGVSQGAHTGGRACFPRPADRSRWAGQNQSGRGRGRASLRCSIVKSRAGSQCFSCVRAILCTSEPPSELVILSWLRLSAPRGQLEDSSLLRLVTQQRQLSSVSSPDPRCRSV